MQLPRPDFGYNPFTGVIYIGNTRLAATFKEAEIGTIYSVFQKVVAGQPVDNSHYKILIREALGDKV